MAGRYFLRAFPLFFCLLSLFILYGCGGASVARQANASPAGSPSAETAAPQTVNPAQPPPSAEQVFAALARGSGSHIGPVAECWLPLLKRLQNDPYVRPEMLRYFNGLPEYSPAPMGLKIKELFTINFLRKKPEDAHSPAPPPSRIYRNVVTAGTVEQCKDYLAKHKSIFDAVEKKYPVSREILVALLFVETRLGTYVGKDIALWSLASMAAAVTPERMAGGMGDIPITNKHKDWLQSKLTERSRWAYNELRALLEYCDANNLDPFQIPGSVFGAIGICQFMPSSIVPYGEDGNGDGVINLFSDPDAIFSAANYLAQHGWKTGMSVDRQRAVIRRYNNSTIYANTILALAESVRTGVLQTGPPDRKPAATPQARTR